jgi:DNA-binding MarR family transcriptional regulator
MVASGSGVRLDELAQELLGLLTRLGMARPRNRRDEVGLTDIEFMTLSLLQDHGTLIVGHLQRLLGVLPAQMSRIIRSLEARERPLIDCHINPQDKRKINVRLTTAGAKALQDYKAMRVGPLLEVLRELSDADRGELARLLEKLAFRGRPLVPGPGLLVPGKAE